MDYSLQDGERTNPRRKKGIGSLFLTGLAKDWMIKIANQLGLESTLRSRARPKRS
jgi:hypothetical protein